MVIMAKSKSKKQSQKGNQKKKQHQPQPVQEKVVVKRKSGCFIALLLLIAIIALVIWLLNHFDIGFFGKNDGGDSKVSSQSESVDELTQMETVNKDSNPPDDAGEKIIDITVSGNQYFYNDGKTEVQDFINEIMAMDNVINVRITDNNAYVEYMEALIDALKENSIPYSEYSADSENK